MTDTPIADSYITLPSLAITYFTGDPRAAAFVALGDGMAWYLKRATKKIDELPLKGTTYWYLTTDAVPGSERQNRQFPRIIDGIVCDYVLDTAIPVVPQSVKDACCEEALALYLFHADTDRTERKTLQEDGVQSYSLGGDYSENLGKSNTDKHKGLLSSEAWGWLKGYIAGSIELGM
jgi:hypothetical protein